jgi:ABC-type amino acid transport substrate-binding protein
MRKTVSLTIVLAVALFGCKKSETASSSTMTTQTSATTATVAPAPQPTATTATTASAAPTAGAIASADGELTGAHIDVTELKRTSGGNVNLKFVISYDGPKEFPIGGNFLGDSSVSKDSYRDVSGIHLVDPVNKKKYFVVTDSEKSCLCSKNVHDIGPGQRTAMWAKFPTPPPEVTKVTIEVPHFQPMDDVPISQ